jgi:hypothetical protein
LEETQVTRDQSHVNTRHDILDWFGPSREVIVILRVLMHYAIEIDSSVFLSGSFWVLSGILQDSFRIVLNVDLSSLFIVRESSDRV